MLQGSGINRRRVLAYAIGTTTTALVAPASWKKPVVNSVLLPAHAQSSPTITSSLVRAFRLTCSENQDVNMTVYQFVGAENVLLGNYKVAPVQNPNTNEWILREPYEGGDFLLSEAEFRTKHQPLLDASERCDGDIPSTADEDFREYAVTCSTDTTVRVSVFQHFKTSTGEVLGNYSTTPRRVNGMVDVSQAQPYRTDLFKLTQAQFVAIYQPELDARPECGPDRCEDEDITIALNHPFGNFSEFSVNKLDIFFPLTLTGSGEVVDINASIVGSGNVSDSWYEIVDSPASLTPASPNKTIHVRYRVDQISDEACRTSFFTEGQKPLVRLVVTGRCATNASITTRAAIGTIGANCAFIKGITP